MRLLAALTSALLLILCYPPFYQSWLVWIALWPLLAALWWPGAPLPARRCFGLGFLTGIVFFTGTFHWLTELASLFHSPALYGVPLLLGSYLALYFGFWGWFMGRLLLPAGYRFGSSARNLGFGALAAAAWISHEWVRGWLFSGFGWNGLGIALHQDLAMIQLAAWTGVLGLSGLIAFVNVMGFIVLRRILAELGPTFLKRIRWEFSATMLVVSLVFAYGVRTLLAAPTGVPLIFKVGVIQPNIPEEQKKFGGAEEDARARATLAGLHQQLAARDLQLIIWPESAIPGGALADRENYGFVLEQMHGPAALLMGTLEYDLRPGHSEEMDTFNGATLFTHHGERWQTYRKMHLVPYGEYLPLRGLMPGFVQNLIPGDLAFGEKPQLLTLPEPRVRLGPLVCFEDTLGELGRGLAREGAQLLVNVTNDAWFGRSIGSEQHLANAVFRAVETRLPLLRCANTGVTCLVRPGGQVERWLPSFTAGVADRWLNFYPPAAPTFYVRHGEWLAGLAAALTGAWLLRAGLRWRRERVQ